MRGTMSNGMIRSAEFVAIDGEGDAEAAEGGLRRPAGGGRVGRGTSASQRASGSKPVRAFLWRLVPHSSSKARASSLAPHRCRTRHHAPRGRGIKAIGAGPGLEGRRGAKLLKENRRPLAWTPVHCPQAVEVQATLAASTSSGSRRMQRRGPRPSRYNSRRRRRGSVSCEACR